MQQRILSLLPGLLLVGLITLLAYFLSRLEMSHHFGLSMLTFAILLGMLCGNTFYSKIAKNTNAGVIFAKGILLRTGIVLYGFRITFQQINAVGFNAIFSDAIMLISTFFITLWVGYHWLKIDKQIVYLSAAGCSICGAAAVMATEPVVKAESHKVAVAIAIVVIFGTLAMFLYPYLYHWLNAYLDNNQFGIYIGSSVHEVAQVYAAGSNINATVADNAVITKMIRVMMLAPFLVLLAYFIEKTPRSLAKSDTNKQRPKFVIPWFAVLFIVMAIVNSFPLIPARVTQWLVTLDGILLAMAMAGLGLTTHISAIKQAGIKPLLLGLIVFIWLVIGGLLVNLIMMSVFN